MRDRCFVVGIVIGGVVACGSPTPDEPIASGPDPIESPTRDANALFQTDSLMYTLRGNDVGYAGTISIRFTNRTGGTAYFVNCKGETMLRLEKLVGDAWITTWAPIIQSCLSQPITVASGGAYESKIAVFGGYPDNNFVPKFSGTIPGIYRIVWTDALSSYQDTGGPFGTQLPFEQRVSNRFALTLAPR
jgi:hypothetical protein